jgi:hypothetical protein
MRKISCDRARGRGGACGRQRALEVANQAHRERARAAGGGRGEEVAAVVGGRSETRERERGNERVIERGRERDKCGLNGKRV